MNKRTPKGYAPPARLLALKALQAFEARGAFVTRVLDEQFQQYTVDPRERRFATELAAETVRRQLTLDKVLSRYVSRPRDSVEEDLWLLLRMGACQLLCLPHIPPHAAVNETVHLCDLFRKARAKPFVNGVLRNLERDIVSRNPVEPPFSQAGGPSILLLAEQRGEKMVVNAVQLARPVFTDPQRDRNAYLSEIASLPRWLVDRFVNQFQDEERLWRTALWLTTPGRMSLRVNPLQTTREKVLEVLEAAEVEAIYGQLPESVVLIGSAQVGNLPGFAEGWFSVQDESAMSAVDLLAPQSGETILDLCSAPGGKTAHIAERLAGTGRVVACDISDSRLRNVDENVTRLRLTNVEVQQVHDHGEDLPAGPFDAVLVDVPCSNTGVLGKRAEARWRLVPASLMELVTLQLRLLNDALTRVKPGGRVVYSTCSIDREENEAVVQLMLEKHPQFELREERRHWPGAPADGGYQALLIYSGN